jgi:hypothetical protein
MATVVFTHQLRANPVDIALNMIKSGAPSAAQRMRQNNRMRSVILALILMFPLLAPAAQHWNQSKRSYSDLRVDADDAPQRATKQRYQRGTASADRRLQQPKPDRRHALVVAADQSHQVAGDE